MTEPNRDGFDKEPMNRTARWLRTFGAQQPELHLPSVFIMQRHTPASIGKTEDEVLWQLEVLSNGERIPLPMLVDVIEMPDGHKLREWLPSMPKVRAHILELEHLMKLKE